MLAKQIGNVTIHFEPLITVLIVTVIVYGIIALLLTYRGKKITKSFESGDYDNVLVDGDKLLKTYQRYAKRYKHKNTLAWIEYLNFAIAVSHFSQKNYELFFNYINALKKNDNVKEFWLSLYYLQQNDLENAKLCYSKIDDSDDTRFNRTYLEGMMLYIQSDYDSAKSKMSEIYTDIRYPILRQMADDILK